MKITGEYKIPASRQMVWEALNNPDILKQSIPGCESMEKTGDNEFTAKVTAKIGPVKAKFGGRVELSNIDPPNSYTISGEGSGGAAGFAKGGADVALEDDGEGTLLKYTVNANVGGKLAQIGSRLIDAAAGKMANDFFSRFIEVVAGEGALALEAEAAEAAPAPAPAGLSTGSRTVIVLIISALLFAAALFYVFVD
ncbi:MAG: carbon monoxide dehydrogenase subunit G [Rhodospirillales bacterium]|nr:carbon monoxide dehydrogenase subunit G [Rhodospirillales bacterium]